MNVPWNRLGVALLVVVALWGAVLAPATVFAQEETESVTVMEEEAPAAEAADLGVGYALDNAMLFITAVMVMFMQAGFAMVEAGFNASKNAVNILFKNLMDFCVGALLFFLVGFGIMYAGNYEGFLAVPHTLALAGSVSKATATERLALKWLGCSSASSPPRPPRSYPVRWPDVSRSGPT